MFFFYLGAHIDHNSSSTWAGYETAISDVTDVNASWIVPSSYEGLSSKSYQWVGVGGDLGSANLLQIGTRYYPGLTPSGYSAWYELTGPTCPFANASDCSPKTINGVVNINDKIQAKINLINHTNNIWRIYIHDLTQNWSFEKNVTYAPDNHSFEFIEERSPWCLDKCHSWPIVSSLAPFGHIEFGSDFTHIANTLSAQANGTSNSKSIGEYYTDADLVSTDFYIQDDYFIWKPIWANTNPITPDGTSFWVTYGDLHVANISYSTPILFGKNATFKAIVPGAANRKLLGIGVLYNS
jgi:hypothetical protein